MRMILRFSALLSILAIPLFVPAETPAQDSSSAARSETSAKSWTAPRTPDGHPDLQGIWSNQTLTPFERPANLAGKEYFTKEEASAFEKQTITERNADGGNIPHGDADVAFAYNQAWWDWGTHVFRTLRTSMIVDPPDGLMPPMTPEAKKKSDDAHAHFAAHPADGPEDRTLDERCVLFPTAGPPMLPEAYNNNYEIVQTHDYVTILPEMNHDARMIPLDGRPHLPQNVRQWKGDSRGRWEGDTLVVVTTNFMSNDQTRFGFVYDGWTDQNLHVTERFKRTGPDTILYRATIVDPTVYTKPWTVELIWTKRDVQLYEYACHEGNYGLSGILSGARADEAKAGPK
jgi:hypothetical protein